MAVISKIPHKELTLSYLLEEISKDQFVDPETRELARQKLKALPKEAQ